MEKNESPDDDIHVSRERNCPLGHFPCLGKLSLSLISVQKDCLISLRSIRHHSFFSTIAESESSSRGMKSSSSFAFSPWTHVCHHGGTIIPSMYWLGRLEKAFSSETIFLGLATTFSHYLGLKQCRKPKIENFYGFFHPVQALQSFTT